MWASRNESQLATSPLPSQGPKGGRNCYVTPAFSRVPQKGDTIRIGCLTPAFSGARKIEEGSKSELVASSLPALLGGRIEVGIAGNPCLHDRTKRVVAGVWSGGGGDTQRRASVGRRLCCGRPQAASSSTDLGCAPYFPASPPLWGVRYPKRLQTSCSFSEPSFFTPNRMPPPPPRGLHSGAF